MCLIKAGACFIGSVYTENTPFLFEMLPLNINRTKEKMYIQNTCRYGHDKSGASF